jgi:hypothetical protein
VKSKTWLSLALSGTLPFLVAPAASADQVLSCYQRAVQVVQETQNATIQKVTVLDSNPGFEAYDVFFMKNPVSENGISRILLWKSNCSVSSLRTAKTEADLNDDDLEQTSFGPH